MSFGRKSKNLFWILLGMQLKRCLAWTDSCWGADELLKWSYGHYFDFACWWGVPCALSCADFENCSFDKRRLTRTCPWQWKLVWAVYSLQRVGPNSALQSPLDSATTLCNWWHEGPVEPLRSRWATYYQSRWGIPSWTGQSVWLHNEICQRVDQLEDSLSKVPPPRLDKQVSVRRWLENCAQRTESRLKTDTAGRSGILKTDLMKQRKGLGMQTLVCLSLQLFECYHGRHHPNAVRQTNELLVV